MDTMTMALIGAGVGAVAAFLFMKRGGGMPEGLREKVAAGEVILVDVREPGEWKAGHLKHAKSVPLSTLRAGRDPKLSKSKPIYLHCASGMRVRAAKPLLDRMGYEDVTALGSGYSTLVAKGFERA
jgi:rhodanese-related sulfurtransferase